MTHFSPAVVLISRDRTVELDPERVELAVGQSTQVLALVFGAPASERTEAAFGLSGDDLVTWGAVKPFDALRAPRPTDRGVLAWAATVSCEAATDGWAPGAYKLWLGLGDTAGEKGELIVWLDVLGGLDIFGITANFRTPGYELSGEGKCNAGDDETATPTSTSESGSDSSSMGPAAPAGPTERSGRNSGYDINVSGSSGDTPVTENDCYGEDAPLNDCPDTVDIVHMAWEMDSDQPNLLKVAVTSAGPFAGADTTTLSVTVWGGDTNTFGVQANLRDYEVSCNYPGQPDSPLPGETCEVNASGQVEVVLDVSGTVGGFRLSARSSQYGDDGRKEDKVYLIGIERP